MTTLTISLLRYRHSFVWLSLEAISGMEGFYFSFKITCTFTSAKHSVSQ